MKKSASKGHGEEGNKLNCAIRLVLTAGTVAEHSTTTPSGGLLQ